jgi:hypothetical protein
MFLSKHFALFLTAALFVASAGAADIRTNRLRGVKTEGKVERVLKSDKSKSESKTDSKSDSKSKTESKTESKSESKFESKSKSKADGNSGPTSGQPQSLTDAVVVIKPQPITPKATLEDWVRGCSDVSRIIDNCIGQPTFVSNARNCKTCLKALGSLQNPPPAYGLGKDGVTLCAKGPTCGGCRDDQIRGFYACGLEVNEEKSAGQTIINPITPITPVSPVKPFVPITPITPIIPITPSLPVNGGAFNLVDDYNCPAVMPDTGEECVMIAGYNAKACTYPEEMDSRCTCDNGDLFWTCVGNNVSNDTPADPVVDVVCTADVRLCADGSFVGRSPPTCEFMCPEQDTMAMAGIDAEVNAFVP